MEADGRRSKSWLIFVVLPLASTIVWSCVGGLLPDAGKTEQNTNASRENARAFIGRALPVQIPLCVGLKIVRAVNEENADYEAITSITAVDSKGVQTLVTTGKPDVADLSFSRRIRIEDFSSARTYQPYCWSDEPEEIPGTTFFTFSTALHQELRAGKEVALRYRPVSETLIGSAHRVGDNAVMHPVVVNNRLTELPTIDLEGVFAGELAGFRILDDEKLPLVLHRRIAYLKSDVIKISFPTGEAIPEVERQLAEIGRADLYDIYFDFAKATLRPESRSVLQQIAETLNRNTSWRISIHGHTDGIGNDQDNQLLSQERAQAVLHSLIGEYGISAERLSSQGHGETQPKDTNETMVGRARNRRVELVRY